jgi:prolyl oligopeptidase
MYFGTIASGQDYKPFYTKENTFSSTVFNKEIINNYRWLENLDSPDAIEWIHKQNNSCSSFLLKALDKTDAYNSIELYSYAEYNRLIKRGKYFFLYKKQNFLAEPILYYQSTIDGKAELLMDPNDISIKDKINLRGIFVSHDSKLLAYKFSRNDNYINEVRVVSLKNGRHEKDCLYDLIQPEIAWMGNGFYYTTYSEEGKLGQKISLKVYYHKLGTGQQRDSLLFKRDGSSHEEIACMTTYDERYFTMLIRDKVLNTIDMYYLDNKAVKPEFIQLFSDLKKFSFALFGDHDGKLIALTFGDSDNGSIVEIDPTNPNKWRAISSKFSDAMLTNAIAFNDRIVAVYQSNQHPVMMVLDYSGEILYYLQLPAASSVELFSARPDEEEIFYNYTSYSVPPIVYKFNIRTFKREVVKKTSVTYDFENIKYREVEYYSKDSLKIPMILVFENELKLDGKNPVIIETSWGIGSFQKPAFDPGIIYFIKNGGICAFPDIRGGGNRGNEWAKQGQDTNWQNAVNDIIAAAQYLIDSNYTCASKLASIGSSFSGQITALAAIQRPELFRALVLVEAPLVLMHPINLANDKLNTIQCDTMSDSISNVKYFEDCPFYNIREDINYPAMLIITSENSDLIPPYDSYEFTARLQSRSAQQHPILLETLKNPDHNTTAKLISDLKVKADIYGFITNELLRK